MQSVPEPTPDKLGGCLYHKVWADWLAKIYGDLMLDRVSAHVGEALFRLPGLTTTSIRDPLYNNLNESVEREESGKHETSR